MEKMNYSEEEKERMVQLLARGVNVAFELDSLKNKYNFYATLTQQFVDILT